MAQTYLLTTPDGEELHVEASQAGDILTTPGGKQIEVPPLRELRKLPTVDQGPSTPQRKWSLGQSMMFVPGLLMVIIGAASLVFLLNRNVPSPDVVRVPESAIEEEVANFTLEQTLSFWSFATDPDALNQVRQASQPHREFVDFVGTWRILVGVSSGAIVIGVILMGISLALPGKRLA